MADIITQPITLEAKKSKLLNVTFNHSSHKGITCFTCHHKNTETGRYAQCSECHPQKGRTQEKMTSFVAFHAKDSSHSCYSCHLKKAMNNPERYGAQFRNCRPCHYNTMK
ncbi:MAG: cytochrome c3 family protein [Desulfovibrio sp.]|nr:cytochrome c3 family protein [Desulfovibrio sp.]